MDEMLIDSFAGGGGASLGITWAIGRHPDVAINHDVAAILMHQANHPTTRHYLEDVWKLTPRKVTQGKPIGLLWCSPDCKHFSRAKGGQPITKNIRSLAWVAVKWAEQSSPRVIVIENVPEFQLWSPLIPRWRCRDCGWQGTEGQAILVRRMRPRACPRCDSLVLKQTTDLVPDPDRKGLSFKRFVGRLRGLGYEVECRVLNAADYGAPTHRRRLFLIARGDGQPIVWPIPTHGDPQRLHSQPRKPWRTAAECIDWTIPCPSIFTRKRPLVEATLRRIALGIKRYVLDNPKPFLVDMQRDNAPRSVEAPLGTVTTQGNRFNLVQPVLWSLIDEPRLPESHQNHSAEVAAFIAKHFRGATGAPVESPLPTTTTRGTQNQIVMVNLIHLNHGDKQWSGCDEPMRTITAGGTHAALVYSFLTKYFGSAIGQSVEEPLHTLTSKDRFGVVTVTVNGDPYVIVDIGMRMLTPRELARAQGFPEDYVLTGTRTNQIARIGNSVVPHVAEAVVKANCAEGRQPLTEAV